MGASMRFGYFVACSVVVHVVLFGSIFDIYFTSPLVQGVRNFHLDSRVVPPARRLVLFVADGLRADKLYEDQRRAPFLRDIILRDGTWGVSHTHIPTESRPGHVALIAGFYEDVSAIMKGWKENPVEFDSVFNQSRETWAWGSPDILPMFDKGFSSNHVHTHCYHSDTESFAGDDSSKLDTWVFDKVEEFFDKAKKNATLHQKLLQNQIVFFLHLLGIDTNGHSHKPMSSEYLKNIALVDDRVNKTVRTLNEFYGNDGKTAFIFTSDHGMTDWGSHGAGHPSETLTPLIAWGAGVASPSLHSLSEPDDVLTRSWGLDPQTRNDVEQADVTALMSALLGLPYPVNSVGLLPVQYLSGSMQQKAMLGRANAKQIAEQFSVKMRNVKEHAMDAFFRPFPHLSLSGVLHRDKELGDLISNKEYIKAIAKSEELVGLSLKGLRYYHTYDRKFLYFSVMLSFVGWMFLTVILGVKQIHLIVSQAGKLRPIRQSSFSGYQTTKIGFVVVSALVIMLLLAMKSPWTYYVYCILPVPIWYSIVADRFVIRSAFGILRCNGELTKNVVIYSVVCIVGVWIMIGSFFYRNFLFPGLFGMSILPVCQSNRTESLYVGKIWTAGCICLSVFTLLPVVGRNPDMRLVISGGIFATIMCIMLAHDRQSDNTLQRMKKSLKYFCPIIAACITAVASSQSSIYGTVSSITHMASWTILGLSWVAPLMSSTNMHYRLTSLYAWQMSAYMLLSLSYDAIFCVVLCGLMHNWIHLEFSLLVSETKSKQFLLTTLSELDFRQSHMRLDEESAREPNFSDVRRSFMLVFFLVVAFFGVGNIASINSFDIRVVLPFLTVFDPFVMGGLLAYKVLLPYLMVTCSFCGIALATRMPLRTLCCIVMVISDFMAMHFVFMVKDQGSWLDIGTSISHFVIVMAMITSLLLFFVVANFLTTFTLRKSVKFAN